MGFHPTLGLMEACIVGMTVMSDLYDSAQKQGVFRDTLEGRHEEGAQVHSTQCCVVILRDIQKDSEKTKNTTFS